jgi:hypothetical protein
MLNDYHLQFLHLLHHRGARFLVIGGQARYAHFGTPTQDLDIWVDISAKSRPALDHCLVSWKEEHSLHTLMCVSHPLELRPNVQIKFPDADALYLKSNGEMAEISAEDGDILTSIGEADFESYYDRASQKLVHGLKLPFLAVDDIEAISPRT